MLSSLLDAALDYANRGFPVFPLHNPINSNNGLTCSCGDPKCEPKAKHPRISGGFKGATADATTIKEWWSKWPNANIGIPTGAVSGFDVIDIDNELAGQRLKEIISDDSRVPVVKTGRGHQLFFAHAADSGLTTASEIAGVKGLDFRGDGGYIVAAPSRHITGKTYTWIRSLNGSTPPLPETFIKFASASVDQKTQFKERFDSSVVWEGIAEGKRDEQIFKYACQLRALNAPEDVARDLVSAAAARCKRPFDNWSAKVDQAYKYPAGSLGATQLPQEWPEVKTLPDELPPVPALSPLMIPEPFRRWLCDIADRMQCPLDFPVIGAVIAAASLIGRRLAIRPKRQDDWLVIPNLWGGAVGRPGIMKTPALDEAKKPLQRLEVEAIKDHENAKQVHEVKLMVLKAKKEEIQKKIKEAIAAGNSTDGFEIPKEEELNLRRYMVNDTTVEKLGELLNQNPNGLLLFRDELTGWLRTLDREGHENDRAFYLESWNGNGSYTYDRIGRGTLNIEAACISVLGGIQPGPLNDYLELTLKGGAGADGLFQRFQLLVYPDDPGPWKNIDRWPDTDAKNIAFGVFKKVAGEGFGGFVSSLGVGIGGEHANETIPFLRFSPDGQEVFDDWRQELEAKIRNGDEHFAVEAHLSKYRSLMPSLALVFHVIATIDDEQATPVSDTAAKMATAWCDYLEAHARRIYHGLIRRDISTAHRLAKKLVGGDLPNPFTTREVYRKGWTGLADDEVIDSGAAMLDELGWIKIERVGAGAAGGRPTLKYWINPNVPQKAA